MIWVEQPIQMSSRCSHDGIKWTYFSSCRATSGFLSLLGCWREDSLSIKDNKRQTLSRFLASVKFSECRFLAVLKAWTMAPWYLFKCFSLWVMASADLSAGWDNGRQHLWATVKSQRIKAAAGLMMLWCWCSRLEGDKKERERKWNKEKISQIPKQRQMFRLRKETWRISIQKFDSLTANWILNWIKTNLKAFYSKIDPSKKYNLNPIPKLLTFFLSSI